VLRSSDLLRVEASLARVSQSGLKTGGDATAGGARDTITEVVKGKLKTDGSMQRVASDPATLPLTFSIYKVLGAY
jgi:hypothetical protein